MALMAVPETGLSGPPEVPRLSEDDEFDREI